MRLGEQIGPQDAQHSLEHRDGHEADHDDVESAEGSADQHLVDDDLEEQRRDEGEQLQEERGDQHLGQMPAVFVNGAQEPGDVEPPRQLDQAGAARHQDDVAVPDVLQLGPRHDDRTWRQRRLDDRLVVADLADEQELAVVERGNGGQGRGREPLPSRAVGLDFQTHFLGAADHVRDADSVFAQPVAQLLRVGADAMEPQQHDQGGKPRIHRPQVWILSVHLLPKSPTEPGARADRYRLARLRRKRARVSREVFA